MPERSNITTPPSGRFITFEGTEGGGKSTQIALLSERLSREGHRVRVLREPGGTPIGEEIRHTLKHSANNHAMTPEAELLLMNASRAQLVREVIRPALAAGEMVLCDRFFDSTLAYQGYGRQLGADIVSQAIGIAVGNTKPDLTVLLRVPLSVSEERRRSRGASGPPPCGIGLRRRIGVSLNGSSGATTRSQPRIPSGYGWWTQPGRSTRFIRRSGPRC